LVATPLFEESLRDSQGDRLSEAHDADERSNIYIALPGRLAKVQPVMRENGQIYLFAYLLSKILGCDGICQYACLSKKTHI